MVVGQIGVDMEHVVQVVVLVNKHVQEVVRNQHQVLEVTNVKDHHNDNEIVTSNRVKVSQRSIKAIVSIIPNNYHNNGRAILLQ